MKHSTVWVAFGLAVAAGASAQTAELKPAPSPTVVMRDGGSSQVLESIDIAPIAKAPFSGVLETEWERPLAEGGSWTSENRRHISRDSSGRIYQERWLLMPRGSKVPSQMTTIQIADPIKHTWIDCFVRSRTCEERHYRASTDTIYKPSPESSGELAHGNGVYTHEALGENTVSGVATVGMRDTDTIAAGVIGNDRPFKIVREFWFSPKLGFNVLSSVADARFGTQRFRMTELTETEPDLSLFAIPKGYTMLEPHPVAAQ